ncbi:MAG: hypothetical protein RLZ98_2473 [Pseudomonadota bacterium]|jgi:hypothetical protein
MADDEGAEFRRKFRAVMIGAAAGSATFLLVRYLFSVSVDVGLVIFGFVSFAAGTFMWTYRPPKDGGQGPG